MTKRWTGPTAPERRRLARIAEELASIGIALPGSVVVRSYVCGKTNCACHRSPARLHGPYTQWSRRADNKTVHANLSPDQFKDYQGYFDNHRRLRALVEELEALSLVVIERDPRFEARRARRR